MENVSSRIKQKLWARFREISSKQIDNRGYVLSPQDNLLPGVKLADFQIDYQQGSGNELVNKFRAVHSSSALVANTFAPWKKAPSGLLLCGQTGFEEIIFEKKCPTGLRGTPPNLDVLVENETIVIGVESKLSEYLIPKRPGFSGSYTRGNLPNIEDKWWAVLEAKRTGVVQYLDVGQLIKHYLGLRNQEKSRTRKLILLYLFWEPTNWQEIDICVKHRAEIEEFGEQVADTSVEFVAQSYPELWAEWENHLASEYRDHLQNLYNRYVIAV